MLELSKGNTSLRRYGKLQDSLESPTERSMHILLVNPGSRQVSVPLVRRAGVDLVER